MGLRTLALRAQDHHFIFPSVYITTLADNKPSGISSAPADRSGTPISHSVGPCRGALNEKLPTWSVDVLSFTTTVRSDWKLPRTPGTKAYRLYVPGRTDGRTKFPVPRGNRVLALEDFVVFSLQCW